MTRHFAKFILALFAGVLLLPSFHAAKINWKEVARCGGGKLKIRVKVVDEDGKPVPGAELFARFDQFLSGKFKVEKGSTDRNGEKEFVEKTDEGAFGTVKKDGFYTSGYAVDLRKEQVDFRDGKWHPFPLEKTVVLKRKVRPVPMYVFPRQELEVPRLDEDFGYDMEYGDFVEPVGDGKVADFFVRFTCVDNDEELYRTIVLSFPNALDGAYLFEKDTHSELASPYEADLEADYRKEFIFTYQVNKKIVGNDNGRIEDKRMPEIQGLVLRTRTKVDANGTLMSAHYGKFYGQVVPLFPGFIALNFGGITTYWNPVENDPSIEFGEKMPRSMQKGKKRPAGHLP